MARSAAFGVLVSGLLLWLHTFQALAMLQFTPSVETRATFAAWSVGMLSAPIVVIASALLIALLATRSRAIAVAALLVTAVLAARVWENIEGYLTPNEAALPISGTPLAYQEWPFVYQHGWLLFAGVAVLAIALAAYSAYREPLRLLPLVAMTIIAVAAIAVAGEVSFAAMAFLRIRNWSFVVAGVECGGVAAGLRAPAWPTHSRIMAIALLAVVLACTYFLHTSWMTIASELPRNVPAPWW